MDSPDALHAAFEGMMDRLVEARWLEGYSWTEGAGWHLVWSARGTEISDILRMIITSHGLTGDDRAPLLFDVTAQGGSLPDARFAEDLDPLIAATWLRFLGEIPRRPTGEDDLLVFCHVIEGWG